MESRQYKSVSAMSSTGGVGLSNGQSPVLSSLMKSHCKVIRSMNVSRQAGPVFGASTAFQALADTIQGSSLADNVLEQDWIPYKTLLDMLSSMVGVDGSAKIGSFAPINVHDDDQDGGWQIAEECRHRLTTGSKAYLETQFESYLNGKVDNALSKGLLSVPTGVGGNMRWRKIRLFVSLMNYKEKFPQVCMHQYHEQSAVVTESGREGGQGRNAVPLWPYIYFCVRVGALEMALKVLQGATVGKNDDGWLGGETFTDQAVVDVIRLLIQYLAAVNQAEQSYATMADTVPAQFRSKDCEAFVTAVKECQIKYREALLIQQPHDPFWLQIMNMFALNDVGTLHMQDSTLEDYLWHNNWFAFFSGVVHKMTSHHTNCNARLDQNMTQFYR